MNEDRRNFFTNVNAGLVLTLVLLTGIGLLCWWNMRTMIESGRWQNHTYIVIQELGDLLSSIKDVETGQRGFLITGDQAYLRPYHEALGEVDRHMASLKELTRDNPQQQQRLNALEPVIRERLALVKQTIDLRASQGFQAAYQIVDSGRGRALMMQIRNAVAQAQAEEGRLLKERSEAKEKDTHQTVLMLLFGGLFSLAILLLVFILLKRELGRRLAAEHELRLHRDHLAEIVDERTRELTDANTHLQRSEQRYRSFVEASSQVVWRTNAVGEVDMAIPAWQAFTGQSEEEARGLGWMNAIRREDHERVGAAWCKAVATRGLYEVDYLLHRHDGEWRSMLARGVPVFEPDGRIREWIGSCIDITERKQAEEAMRQSEEKYRIIVESATDYAIFTLDLDWRVTSWNSGAQHLLGYSEAEILGQNMGVIFTEEDRRQGMPEADMRTVLASGRTRNERWYRRKDGGRFWGIGMMMAQHDDQGNPIGYLKILQDITERKRLEEELEQRVAERTAELKESYQRLESLNAKLAVSNRELQDFAFVASHDLQEPLRKVMAFGDILITDFGPVLGDTGADYLRRMQSAASRMQALIGDLLQFSRVTTKAQPFISVKLGRVAAEVISDLEVRIGEHGGRVELGELPTIEADPMQMRQLLQNLVGNALKFARPETPPLVRIFAETPAEPAARADGAEDHSVTLYVADNGIGFDEKYLDRIFTVFQRLHGRGVYEGTGIGLAICRRIVERHGGSITARSRPGEGSTFIVNLPLRQSSRRSANGS